MTTDKKRTTAIATLLIVFCILQSSCSTQINNQNINMTATAVLSILGDGGFMSDKPCGPPCFFGVIPGITTREQAISKLQSYGLYQDCEQYDTLSQGGTRGVACQTVGIGLQNHIDIVSNIGYQPSKRITVSAVIAKFGEPTAVLVTAIGSSDKPPVTGMTLFYDNIRISLGLAIQDSGMFDLEPAALIESVEYDDQDMYNLGKEYSQKWNGYGVYQETNP